jgi:hypothetical protein
VKIVGSRTVDAPPFADQRALVRTATALRGTPWLVPRGVYRFSSFEEADRWLTETMARTFARLSQRTYPESAGR